MFGVADSNMVRSPSVEGSRHAQGQQEVPFESNQDSLKVLLLHGNLDIWVKEAKNLPDMDTCRKNLGDMFSKLPGMFGKKTEEKITTGPYVTISISGAVVGKTFVISNSENPVWMQHFNVPVAHSAAEIRFVVKDNYVVGSQIMGTVGIPVEQLYTGGRIEGTYPIIGANGKPWEPGAALTLSIQFTPVEKMAIYKQGVDAGPEYTGVPGTYFPLRKAGKVTLYQDAHVHGCDLPDLKLDGPARYEHRSCWDDIFSAISQAQRLVYVTGWSVYHKVKLVRDGKDGTGCTLGDLLKTKSQEGVRVLLLVWDDPTSRSLLGNKIKEGLMHTRDEEIRRFFKHSSVQLVLCPGPAGKGHRFMKKQEFGTTYTHHQKTVIVDADAGNNRRKIIAFLGGLDLCQGRYDSPHHPLYKTLQTVHKDDFHNPNFKEGGVGVPRQPWHDLHCKIDGPAAYDVLTNFEERWRKDSGPHGIRRLIYRKASQDDALLSLERLPEVLKITEVSSLTANDPEAWHVQVFRSIDSNSVEGFPDDPKEATRKNLLCGKNLLIDASIQLAYIKAIRAAQHFIYIENQYFLGSSYNWDSYKELGANNLIPMEIALKIANKVRAKERFAAYIVIPMWPEGDTISTATQRILLWQHKTMQMMYQTIYDALLEVGLQETYKPQDYLNFFCLGNREVANGESNSTTHANTPQDQIAKNRRFMIYVHSKGMIVDDEYLILGSANINQRSMAGTRDSEIAMGAYQPLHILANRCHRPRGQVYGYRISLWAEHIGEVEDFVRETRDTRLCETSAVP